MDDDLYAESADLGINSDDHPIAIDLLMVLDARAEEAKEALLAANGDVGQILVGMLNLMRHDSHAIALAIAKLEAVARGSEPPRAS